jgi:hypothetical protein
VIVDEEFGDDNQKRRRLAIPHNDKAAKDPDPDDSYRTGRTSAIAAVRFRDVDHLACSSFVIHVADATNGQ